MFKILSVSHGMWYILGGSTSLNPREWKSTPPQIRLELAQRIIENDQMHHGNTCLTGEK